MSAAKLTPGLDQQLREAEDELAFCQRMHQQYRITERLTAATARVQELRAAIAKATGSAA